MLTITKKAATEAECDAILQSSWQADEPLGVQTILIDPEDYKPAAPSLRSLFQLPPDLRVKDKIYNAVMQHTGLQGLFGPNVGNTEFYRDLCQKVLFVIGEAHKGNRDYHAMSIYTPVDPKFNIVVMQKSADAAREFVAQGLGMPKESLPAYPGYDSQWHCFSLWHEMGHGMTRENEAGADEVGALLSRYAFEDCRFLAVRADLRAAQPVLYPMLDDILHRHSWACVEAIDSAIAMGSPLSPDQIARKAALAGEIAPNKRVNAVRKVGQRLHHIANHVFGDSPRDLLTLSEIAGLVADRGAFETEEETMIAKRFSLAAKRLGTGTPAYTV